LIVRSEVQQIYDRAMGIRRPGDGRPLDRGRCNRVARKIAAETSDADRLRAVLDGWDALRREGRWDRWQYDDWYASVEEQYEVERAEEEREREEECAEKAERERRWRMETAEGQREMERWEKKRAEMRERRRIARMGMEE
jgi:hypothetical protein